MKTNTRKLKLIVLVLLKLIVLVLLTAIIGTLGLAGGAGAQVTQNWDSGTATPNGWTLGDGYSVVPYSAAPGGSSPNVLTRSISSATYAQAYYNTNDAYNGNAPISSKFAWGTDPTSVLTCALIFRGSGALSDIRTGTEYVAALGVTGTSGTVGISRWPAGVNLGTTANFAAGTFAANTYYRLTVAPNGSTLPVSVQRVSDGFYLTPAGAWVSGQQNCYTATDSNISGAGQFGYFLSSGSNTPAYADDFVESAPPSGVASATASLSSSATTSLTLSVAPSGGIYPLSYQWYRSQVFGFAPGAGNLVAGATASTLTDTALQSAATYFYAATVTDSSAAPVTVTSNQVEATTLPLQVYNLCFDGNSLMQGAHSTAGNDPGSQCLRLLGYAYANVPAPGVMTPSNLAIGGKSISTFPSPNPSGYTTLTATAPTLDSHLSSTLTNEAVIWEITNEITAPPQTITAQAVENNLKTYCLARKAAGWEVLVGTALPRSNQPGVRGDFETVRVAVNSWVRANWPTFADGIFDPAADSRIGYPGDELSTTYYYQGASPDLAVHMVDPGYAIAANYMAQAVARLNAASAAGTSLTITTPIPLNSQGQPVLTWTPDPLATSYEIVRFSGATVTVGSAFSVIGTVTAPTTTYTDTTEPAGVTVHYRILPVH